MPVAAQHLHRHDFGAVCHAAHADGVFLRRDYARHVGAVAGVVVGGAVAVHEVVTVIRSCVGVNQQIILQIRVIQIHAGIDDGNDDGRSVAILPGQLGTNLTPGVGGLYLIQPGLGVHLRVVLRDVGCGAFGVIDIVGLDIQHAGHAQYALPGRQHVRTLFKSECIPVVHGGLAGGKGRAVGALRHGHKILRALGKLAEHALRALQGGGTPDLHQQLAGHISAVSGQRWSFGIGGGLRRRGIAASFGGQSRQRVLVGL